MPDFNPCIIIPVYNHEHALKHTVEQLLSFQLTIILIDDGSRDSCVEVMQSLDKQHPLVSLIQRPVNGGKGAAVKSGLAYAHSRQFSHALQIDADGQHNPADIPCFLDTAKKHPQALVSGYPQYDKSVPKHRFYARYATHIWIWINTLSFDIIDSMCGFRVYPLNDTQALVETTHIGNRMDFDSEFIVKWHWSNRPLRQLPTAVIYPDDGVSHFLLWRDNALISWMHTRLFFGMLLRSPILLARRWFSYAKH